MVTVMLKSKLMALTAAFFVLFSGFISERHVLADEENEEPYKGALSGKIVQVSGVPVIDAAAAIVMDAESGRVLYSKNSDQHRSMASTTKIMTGILAIENGKLDDVVTISSRAAAIGGSTIGLRTGQKYTLNELLYGLLLNSGNDASIAIGEHIGGSVEGFVEMMNRKAKDLGAVHTSFANTHGLDAEGHYTTAYDLALITRYALKNPVFAKIVSTQSSAIPGRQLNNTNELLRLYPGADGVKTGYTGKGGRCLVASATRNGMKLISVVLGSPTVYKRALSSKAILDYGFDNYKPHVLVTAGAETAKLPVHKGIIKTVSVKVADTVQVPLREDELEKLDMRIYMPDSLEAPVYAGTETGYIEFLLDGETVGRTALTIWNDVGRMGYSDYMGRILKAWAKMMREGIFTETAP